jgi:hypothetical protein
MAQYFEGRKSIATYRQRVEDGRGQLQWEVFEEWIDIDEGTTARCGMPGTCSVEKSEGISEKATETLKSVLGGTLGVKDVWSVRAELEGAIGREINWNVADKTTKTFQFEAPKCGRYSLTVYRLQRLYTIRYFRKRLFSWGAEKWDFKSKHSFVEKTNTHDLMPDIDEIDPACRCPKPADPETIDGHLSFDFGSISFRAPYRMTSQGFEARIGDKSVAVDLREPARVASRLELGFSTKVPTDLIPEPLRYLGDIETGAKIEARVRRIVEAGVIEELDAEEDLIQMTRDDGAAATAAA